MARPFLRLAAVAVTAFAAACSDQPDPSAPQDGPSFVKVPSPYACAYSGNPSVSNAANAYFTTTADRKKASDLIAAMQNATTAADTVDAGFDLLSFTGSVSRGTAAGDTANGALLVRQTVQCMFDVPGNMGANDEFSGWPTDPQFDYGRALAAGAGGAFFVRGGTANAGIVDPTSAPVVANDPSRVPFGGTAKDGNISGVAPPSGSNWRASPGIVTHRFLVYGEPVTDGYDWKLLPRLTTSFNPGAVVALCPAASSSAGNGTTMVTQQSVGVLGYVNADYICNTDPSTFAHLGGGSGTFAALSRLTSFAGRLLAPEPLQATVLVSTIGGSASGAKGDPFTVQDVPSVELIMTSSTNWKSPLKVNTGNLGTITVVVRTPVDHDPVGGVTVTLSAVNNNGFTQVGQLNTAGTACNAPAPSKTTAATVGQNGNTAVTSVSWDRVCITKTGAVAIIANSQAAGRSGGVGTAASPKMNVKP